MLTNQIVSGNIYIDGNSWFGTFSEAQIADIQQMYEDHVALGQNGKTQFVVGQDLMKTMFKLNSPYEGLEGMLADPYTVHKFQLRGNLEGYTGSARTSQKAYVVHFQGTFMKKSGGTFKSKAKVEIETEVNVTYQKLVIAGVTIYEIDIMNNIYIVNGVDLQAQYRANLGI